jgi:hypothetical protein
MTSKKYLTLKAEPESSLGKTIAYIQSSLINDRGLAVQTLQTRFFPFIVDRNDPEFYQIAIQCAIECEAWGRMIREYAELPVPTIPTNSLISQSLPAPSPTVDAASCSSLSETADTDLDVGKDEDEHEDDDDEGQIAFLNRLRGGL